jgi:hypothetical protein
MDRRSDLARKTGLARRKVDVGRCGGDMHVHRRLTGLENGWGFIFAFISANLTRCCSRKSVGTLACEPLGGIPPSHPVIPSKTRPRIASPAGRRHVIERVSIGWKSRNGVTGDVICRYRASRPCPLGSVYRSVRRSPTWNLSRNWFAGPVWHGRADLEDRSRKRDHTNVHDCTVFEDFFTSRVARNHSPPVHPASRANARARDSRIG